VKKPRRLGRGLRGLINNPHEDPEADADAVPTVAPVVPAPRTGSPPAAAGSAEDGLAARELLVGRVRPNPFQPRTAFVAEDLDDLKASIQEHGVLQPIVVRRADAGGYELIAGERRLRAVRDLGHTVVPAVVRKADDEDMQTLALVENLQRVDLNAIEKARALRSMMRNFGLTQQEAADRVGKARTSISNLVRLLDLPAEIQQLVLQGSLSGAQARAVLLVKGDDARLALARRAVEEGLTVRRIEQIAASKRESAGPRAAAVKQKDPYVADLEERLRKSLGTPVALRPKGRGGRIEIRYHDAGELDRLLERFGAA
jgi:ParB family chromosome partitioning protein